MFKDHLQYLECEKLINTIKSPNILTFIKPQNTYELDYLISEQNGYETILLDIDKRHFKKSSKTSKCKHLKYFIPDIWISKKTTDPFDIHIKYTIFRRSRHKHENCLLCVLKKYLIHDNKHLMVKIDQPLCQLLINC